MFPLLTCRFVMQIFCFHLLVIYRKLLTEKPMESGAEEAEGEQGEEGGVGGKTHISMPIADDGLLCDILPPFLTCVRTCVCVCVRMCVCLCICI